MSDATAALSGSVELQASRRVPARLVPLVIGVVTFAVGAYLVDGLPVGVTNDDSMYVLLAKSLATGHGYRWLNIPGAPPATHFPPGYPAFLALLWWCFPAFPANVVVFKLANALLMALAAVGFYWFLRARLAISEAAAAALTLASTLGIPTLTLSTIVMSEPLFLALLMPSLVFAERLTDRERGRVRDVVGLALLVAVATLVRTHGIALIAAIAVVMLIRRHYKNAGVFLAVTVAMLLPWQLWVSTKSGAVPAAMRGNYESYGAWLAAGIHTEGVGVIARTVARTTNELAAMFAQIASPSLPGDVCLVALIALTVLSALGARELWRRAPATAAFVAVYIAMVIAWPFPPTRFIWGVWPLIILLPVLGARRAFLWTPSTRVSKTARLSTIAAAVLLAVGYASYNVRGYRRQYWSSIPRAVSRDMDPLLQWVSTRTPRSALLATEVETSVYLYTGRPTVPVSTFTVSEYFTPRTSAENAAAIRSIMSRYHPMAVVVSSNAMRNAVRELAVGQAPLLAVVDTFPGGGLVLIPRPQ